MKRTPLKRGTKGLSQGSGFSNKSNNLQSNKLSLKPKKKMKNFSGERAKIEREYQQVTKPAVFERDEGQCRGCGTTQRLSPSHLIPRSHRKDLITCVDNVHLHCMDGDGIEGCHTKHELQKWDQMLDGQVIQQTMKRLDQKYFNRITL